MWHVLGALNSKLRHEEGSRTSSYLILEGFAAFLVLTVLIVSSLFPTENGVLTALLEVLTSSAVVAFLASKRSLASDGVSRLLFLLFSFLLLGDLWYGYLYYWVKIGTPTRVSFLLHEIPLSLSYFLLPITYLYGMGQHRKELLKQPFSIVPLLITLPLMVRFLIPLRAAVSVPLDTLVQIVEAFSLLGTFAGLVLSILVLAIAKDMFWSVFALGMTTSYIAGLGIRLDRFAGQPIHFTGFESAWAFGEVLCALAVIFLSSGNDKISFGRQRSLLLSTRLMGLTVAFAGTVLLSILHWQDLKAVETITYLSLIGVHIAAALGYYLWDRIVEFSNAMEKLLGSELGESLPLLSSNQSNMPVEMFELYAHSVQARINDFRQTSELRREAEVSRQFSLKARQVAHDIRSPLSALKICVSYLTDVPEDYRALLRASTNRLEDIANHLSNQSSEDMAANKSEMLMTHLLPGLVDELVSEKRMQYRASLGVEIFSELNQQAYEAFAKVSSTEFKRALSNLIDNAVEAIGEQGTVRIGLSSNETTVTCTVQDNGKGVAPELLPKLGAQGATFGKAKGQGLGLFHAKTTVEGWGGTLTLESTPRTGTIVRLTLPRSTPPDWFVPRLSLSPEHTVVILDDEGSIHKVWTERIDSFNRRNGFKVKRLHFSTANDFMKHVATSNGSYEKILFLFDHELMHSQWSGTDLIEQLGIVKQSVLVTSRHEEESVHAKCQQLKLKLIPKGLAGLVPIEPIT